MQNYCPVPATALQFAQHVVCHLVGIEKITIFAMWRKAATDTEE
jgi:hypothetical protein